MNFVKFEFQQAAFADIPQIMHLMKTVKSTMPQKEWFVDDDEEYLSNILQGHGFILLAKPDSSDDLAAFFMVKFPGLSEDNLGRHLEFDSERLMQCVHMDSCVVHPDFRGHHLQSRMASLAEQQLRQMPYHYLLGTIHPENIYSMNSMLRCGYHIVKQTYLYGGLPRAILLKEI